MKPIAKKRNWFVNFIVEDKYRIYRHLLVWLYLIITELPDPTARTDYAGHLDLYRRIIKCALFISMAYVNMYILVPRLLFRGRYVAYLGATIGIITSAIYLFEFLFDYFFGGELLSNAIHHRGLLFIISNVNVLSMAIFAFTSIKLLQKWEKDTTRMYELEENALKTELRELKNQIQPHFLFNTLNNVNVLVAKDQAKASAVLLKLSEFLRYQLYETSKPKVVLSMEIEFLMDFIELERIRRDDFNYTISNRVPVHIMNAYLPPNLFLTFVENAVKHSTDPDDISSLVLGFDYAENRLEFTCSNSKPIEPPFLSSGGLGLTNIQRRLELLYGNHYSLEIKDEARSFSVKLSIPL